ncbi:YlaI family protein [Bacillaceae bacterium SIJ1]|uniref:YlaI family protein n=1 Tax=Litoribacterium kuwaitense TaxID=1398745 RepID=UPI0013ED6687|nr:YlaI family protein [Litoribacterium kuwaitense]NGP44386.1 YlaI family protein [Litoribacterium kuwaitense]
MKVKCALCESIHTIDNWSIQAKRLRNRPIHTFLCHDCHSRITEKTLKNQDARQSKEYQEGI